ncbi:MAG TPA: GTPase ObgE [Candidatus Paceibacterota bacterium]|nr:GTPase ObgE [Candidatus Paceibacterota bacterium]
MAFVDELTIHMAAGDGGNGVVRWRHDKGKEYAGPAGGDGGNGGNVYVMGSRDLGLLYKYRHQKEFDAERGVDGGSDSLFGRNGKDFTLVVPVGTVVTLLDSGKVFDVLTEDEPILLLEGGRGGLGNERFKSSTNRSPDRATPGKPGEQSDVHLELRLVVDVGFLGFPNAGKSSLLNELTNATAKIGAYQFTTLEPNLGAFYGYVLADIPGLIEGAATGKGLGIKFLRHVSRTKMLLHLISLENEDVLAAYNTMRKELESFGNGLPEKEEIILLTKTDLVDEKTVEAAKKKLAKLGHEIYAISVIDDVSIKAFRDMLIAKLRSSKTAS